jgi:hypothetical protein
VIVTTDVKWRQWLIDLVAGGVIGGIVGLIVALNVAIFLGVEGGYEAGVGEIFDHSMLAGILWLAALVAGPVAGVAVARRQRQKREAAAHTLSEQADQTL